jgi:hypothetical protein
MTQGLMARVYDISLGLKEQKVKIWVFGYTHILFESGSEVYREATALKIFQDYIQYHTSK